MFARLPFGRLSVDDTSLLSLRASEPQPQQLASGRDGSAMLGDFSLADMLCPNVNNIQVVSHFTGLCNDQPAELRAGIIMCSIYGAGV